MVYEYDLMITVQKVVDNVWNTNVRLNEVLILVLYENGKCGLPMLCRSHSNSLGLDWFCVYST